MIGLSEQPPCQLSAGREDRCGRDVAKYIENEFQSSKVN